MRRRIINLEVLTILLLLTFLFVSSEYGQARQTASGAEVTGTFRAYHKGFYNEIEILALGKGKLKVRMSVTEIFNSSTGDVRTDEVDGIADIIGDTAILIHEQDGEQYKYTITIKFLRPGQIRITYNGEGMYSTFGFGSSFGIYRKFSSAKPKFEDL